MSTTPRLRGIAASALLLAFAGGAGADRPSLIDLQATLDQVVTGLCNGDSATCGVAVPAAAAGQLIFDPGGPDEAILSLVELDLTIDPNLNCTATCVAASAPVLEDVTATVLSSEASGSLLAALVTTAFPIAHVVVPNPAGGGTVLALRLFNPLLEQLTHSSTPGRSDLRFTATRVRFDWLSSTSEWNFATGTGTGCTVPASEAHVELAGNPTSALLSGEIAAVYGLGVEGTGGGADPTLAVRRAPPNACHLRGAASTQLMKPRYDRLWARDAEFPARQSVETLDVGAGWVDRWTLHVRSGVLAESIEMIPLSGTLDLRTFDDTTGAEVSNTSVPFSF
jgi:hypothetical protein